MRYDCLVVWPQGASKRSIPSVNNAAVGFYKEKEAFVGVELVPDEEDPNHPDKLWMKTEDGFYVAVRYPDPSGVIVRVTITKKSSTPPQPKPPQPPQPKPQQPPQPQPVQPRQYNRVLDDIRAFGQLRAGVPLPAVFVLGDTASQSYASHFVPLGPDWQWFWFNLVRGREGKDFTRMEKQLWEAITGPRLAFCNRNEQQADYVLMQNLDREPLKKESLTCTGAILCGEEVLGKKNVWYLKVETLDGRGPAPSIKTVNPIRTPYLVYAATILSGVLKDGSAQITRFPQKGVNKGWPLGQQDVWIPSIANQPVYIKMDYVEKLPLGIEQLPSPYNFE